MRAGTPAIQKAKHVLLTEALSNDICNGKYKIGDRLPSEPELCVRFGVSRHTVRAALRGLHDLGLVTSRQGVGTTVKQTRIASTYTQGFSSAQDLLQYATSTRLQILDYTEMALDAAQAADFGCKPGEHWWRIRTVRRDPSGRMVVAYSEIHIPLSFGAVLKTSGRSRKPIFAQIESRFGETITEIEQEIACIEAMPADIAAHLEVKAGSAAMQIVRRYRGNGARLLEVARTIHPPAAFKYSMRVQLRRGG